MYIRVFQDFFQKEVGSTVSDTRRKRALRLRWSYTPRGRHKYMYSSCQVPTAMLNTKMIILHVFPREHFLSNNTKVQNTVSIKVVNYSWSNPSLPSCRRSFV